MTITIELPDDLAVRLSAIPEGQRNQYAVSALSAGMDALSPEEAARDFEEMAQGVAEGLSDLDAVRTRPLAAFITEQRTAWAAKGL